VSVTISDITPAQPSGITLSAMTSTGPTVSWSAVSNTDAYKVYRSTDNTTWTFACGTSDPAVTCIDTGASTNTTYSWTVTALKNICESSKPAPQTARTALLFGWNMVSCPYNTGTATPKTVYGTWAGNTYDWVSTYPACATPEDPATCGNWVLAARLYSGTSQFVYAFNNTKVLTSSITTPASSAVTVTLAPGWNLISNQTTSPMTGIGTSWIVDGSTTLSDAITAETVGGAIYWWDFVDTAPAYRHYDVADDPIVDPWKGFWILNMDPDNDHTLTIQ
jgi:hypothetical protein